MSVHPIHASTVPPAMTSSEDTDVSVFQDIRVSTVSMKWTSARTNPARMEAPASTL